MGDDGTHSQMETATASTTQPLALLRGFPTAAPPEVMRAAEKDDNYASFVSDACRDAFRHLFGARVAVAYHNETKLLGQMLYYILTTGAGQQTLGEEYCDIVQSSSKRSMGIANLLQISNFCSKGGCTPVKNSIDDNYIQNDHNSSVKMLPPSSSINEE